MTVNIPNEGRGCFVDKFKGRTQLGKLFSHTPRGDISKTIVVGFDTVVGTYSEGNTFCFDFLGATVFRYGRWCGFILFDSLFFFFIIMQLRMGNLMYRRRHGPNLAHALTQSNSLFTATEIAIFSCFHVFKGDGNRGGTFQSLHKYFVLTDITCQVSCESR